MSRGNLVFSRRLKKLRLEMNISQKQLGIQAGIDEFVASTRVNRYEQAIHSPDFAIVQKLAEILNVPVPYFYTEDDEIAELLILFHRSSKVKKREILNSLRT